jgi:predicted nucleic acid-binding protein
VILLDSSGIIAALDQSVPEHGDAAMALRAARPPLLLSPFVLAEVDYLLATREGVQIEMAFLDQVSNGVYVMAPFGPADVAEARGVIEKYGDVNVGLTDASLVVLARRHGVHDVLTLDERHFRALRPSPHHAFRLLPADAGPR